MLAFGTTQTCSALQILRQLYGVKRSRVVASGLRLGGLFSLELVDGTRTQPRHASRPADAEALGEFVPGAGPQFARTTFSTSAP
jgi:hypothetical protein